MHTVESGTKRKMATLNNYVHLLFSIFVCNIFIFSFYIFTFFFLLSIWTQFELFKYAKKPKKPCILTLFIMTVYSAKFYLQTFSISSYLYIYIRENSPTHILNWWGYEHFFLFQLNINDFHYRMVYFFLTKKKKKRKYTERTENSFKMTTVICSVFFRWKKRFDERDLSLLKLKLWKQ